MDTNNLSVRDAEKVAVVILKSGEHHPINQEVYEYIFSLEDDTQFITPDKNAPFTCFRVSAINQILEMEDYKKLHPEKNPTGRQVPLEYSGSKQLAITQIAIQFEWVKDMFNFANLEQLVEKTWDALNSLDNDLEFMEFCKKHKAITPEGEITTATARTKTGFDIRVPFAYPFFTEVWKAIQVGRRKVAYASDKSFEGLGVDGMAELAADTGHLEALARGIKRQNPENILLKGLRVLARKIKAENPVVDKVG